MRIQASISIQYLFSTEALGYWPAFWTLGGAYLENYQNWPAVREFDVMENEKVDCLRTCNARGYHARENFTHKLWRLIGLLLPRR